jgi:tetratricopeptide (TPR) repeat protein
MKDQSVKSVILAVIVVVLGVTISCDHASEESTPVANTSAAEDINKAQQLYAQREDLTKVREGVVALRQATTKDPGNYEAQWQLAKFNYYLATHTSDATERDKAFRDGINAGKTAAQLQPQKPDGHFWLGANYGGAAEQSAIQGLSTVDDIKNEMETVLKIDEGYQNGSAYMVLGLVYLNAPALVGGDPGKAVEVMEKGKAYGEPNAFFHLNLAKAYAKVGRKDDARNQLDAILKMSPDQNYLPEYKEASTEAQKLKDDLK